MEHSDEFTGSSPKQQYIVHGKLVNGKDAKTGTVPDSAESVESSKPEGATATIHDHPTAGPHITDGLIDASTLGDDQAVTQQISNVAINGNRVAVHEAPEGHLRMRMLRGTMDPSERETIGKRLDQRQQLLEQIFKTEAGEGGN